MKRVQVCKGIDRQLKTMIVFCLTLFKSYTNVLLGVYKCHLNYVDVKYVTSTKDLSKTV